MKNLSQAEILMLFCEHKNAFLKNIILSMIKIDISSFPFQKASIPESSFNCDKRRKARKHREGKMYKMTINEQKKHFHEICFYFSSALL